MTLHRPGPEHESRVRPRRERRGIVVASDLLILGFGVVSALWLLSLPACELTPCQAAQQAGSRVLCTMSCRSTLLYAYRVPLLVAGTVLLLTAVGVVHSRAAKR